ncbi:MAG: peptide chain release factor 1 [Candidatus Izimaplasma sp.]|nr:peptide chain release factor 1 [Candidatus Izimaplasma bacterium]
MIKKLENVVERFEEINNLMMDQEVATDIPRVTELSKERSHLEPIVMLYKKYQETQNTIEELEELIKLEDDEEFIEMAKLELHEAKDSLPKIEEKLKELLIPKDPDDKKDVIMEIRGAAGGSEGNIFAGDLYRMYSRYAETQGWNISVQNAEEGSDGGYTQIEFTISGNHVYSQLKYESGAHRVQRIPKTESGGRIHTSTATVLVLPEAEDVDVELDMNDVKVDTYRSSGPGGQSVNTTDSAVRLTHEPTGIVVSCQDEKSQHGNKASALRILKARIYDRVMQEREEKEGAERRSKIGTGDRSEKIRTYNYPQNRVTDHRIHLSIQQLDRIIDGKLDDLIEALQTVEMENKLKAEEE